MRAPSRFGLLLVAWCGECTTHGGGGVTDGAAAAADAGWVDAAVVMDAGDAGAISDWPGWRRLTEVDPSCPMDAPLDMSALPQVRWIPCTDGRPQCTQFDTTALNDGSSSTNFGPAYVTPSASYLVLLGRPVVNLTTPGATWESDIIDVSNWTTRMALRTHGVSGQDQLAGEGVCVNVISATDTSAAFVFQTLTHPAPMQLEVRQAAALSSPVFQPLRLDVDPWTQLGQSIVQNASASTAAVAVEYEAASLIGRIASTSSHVALTAKLPLRFPLVVGSDVYAIDESSGWSRIMRVNVDGTTTEYRAIPGHRVATPASDGSTMYWTECYGNSDPTSSTQPNVEMWAAPYTNDPATLAATAQKIATLGTTCVYDQQQLAQNGMFFAISGLTNYAYRRSDGKLLTFTNGGNRATWYPLYISATEYWSVEAERSGPKGVALTRLHLAPW